MSKILLLCALISPLGEAFVLRSSRNFVTNLSVLGSNKIVSKAAHTIKLFDKNPLLPSINEHRGHRSSMPINWLKKILLPASVFASLFFLHQTPAFATATTAVEALSQTISQKIAASGFIQAYLLIFVSELGDKTFFIAGLLAAKYTKFISFTGSMGALAVMTILCTILGQIFHAVPASISQGIPFDDYVAVAAFAYFGVKTLMDAFALEPSDSSGIEEELEEAEKSVAEMSSDERRKSTISLILQTFSLVFAAEIGDKSFLSTIALAAAQNPFSVATGAIAAHATATGIAVIGGALLTKYLSEKTIGYIGGTLFILFAVTTAFGIF